MNHYAGPDQRSGDKGTGVTLSSECAAAFDKAKNAVESPRYRYLLLETLRWLEDGDWERRSRDHGDQRIERFAADILARRAKKAIKKAKKLGELDARDRHKLRIAIKKLSLRKRIFRKSVSRAQTEEAALSFQGPLKGSAGSPGRSNDIAVQQKLATRIAAGGEGTKPRARAFAAGVASGREQGEIEPLLEAAVQDARKFAHVRPFWLEE